MIDQGQRIQSIDWQQVLPFTALFRAFRIAIHPSKLALGLALLLTIYVGGRALDWVWSAKDRAVIDEVALYQTADNRADFDQARAAALDAIRQTYAEDLLDLGVIPAGPNAEADAQIDAQKAQRLDDALSQAAAKHQQELAANHDPEQIPDIDAKWSTLTLQLLAIRGQGLFSAFFGYEINQFVGVVDSVLTNQWAHTPDVPGVLGHIYNFLVVGPLWLARVHPIFAILFAIIYLGAWALFGGAIARLTALQVARDDRISMRQAMDFAVGKFLSFLSAPIIPLAIVVIVGLLVAAASLVGNIPFLGPIIIGGGFAVALLGGFVMTLVILGSVGGFNLMYPTIAVEGSDSFDAISRSFSYVYACPWRMLFYTAVAVGYGAATYLFVRFFLILMLALTHHFVGMSMYLHDLNGHPLFPTMWPDPLTSGRLTYHIDFSSLDWGQKIGAGLLSFWIYLLIGTLGAFAISFYFAANTIIYFLMRRELDATELDDVYLEVSEDEPEMTESAVIEVQLEPPGPGVQTSV
jgi:hypothetical protein